MLLSEVKTKNNGQFKKGQIPHNKNYHSLTCKRGHARTNENIWLNPKDNRIYCRVCWKIRAETNREKNRLTARNAYHRNKHITKTLRRIQGIRYTDKLKREVLQFYGNNKLACLCCGENTYEFLTIDHINNNGSQERKLVRRTGHNIYRYLRKNNFPIGYQTLCFNCNSGKQINKGICPHKMLTEINIHKTWWKVN